MRGRGGGVRGSAGRAGPGHGRLGVAHTEVTGFTCRGAGRSPSGVPCLPRQRIKGFESRSEQDDSYICGSICDAERESHEEPARADHGARRGHAGGHADLPGGPASPRPKGRGGSGALPPGPFRPAHADLPRGLHAPDRVPLRAVRTGHRKVTPGAFGALGRDDRPERRRPGQLAWFDDAESRPLGLSHLRPQSAIALRQASRR